MRDRLIIFCRYPVPGKTKTRLIPALGSLRAADLHKRLAEMTFLKVKEFALEHSMDLEVCFEEGNKKKMRRWLGPGPLLSTQIHEDLGRRMHHAFSEAFKQGCKKVVLIGTDVPEATKEHLRFAFNALDNHDVVLGPAHDGGYWLIGLTRLFNIFENIQWGGDRVLESTLSLVERIGLKTSLLDPLRDIDTIDDVTAWNIDESTPGPYLSVIIPAINEEANIEKTIARVRDDECEVIVADGGSSDRTTAIAAKSGVCVISTPRGRALQQNAGADASNGKVLLFLHADTLLPEGYAAKIFEAMMNQNVVAGAFRFATDLDGFMMRMIEFTVNLRSRYLRLPYGDQGLFLRKSLFETVGGFPDEPIAEDLLLVRRLSRLGKICIVPATVITSGRRWKKLGLIRTTVINAIILIGCLAGVKPERLAWLYNLTADS